MIHAELKQLIIRGGVNFKEFGDVYDWSLTVSLFKATAYIYNFAGKKEAFRKSDYIEIYDYLVSIGITEAHWERIKGTTTTFVVKKIKP